MQKVRSFKFCRILETSGCFFLSLSNATCRHVIVATPQTFMSQVFYQNILSFIEKYFQFLPEHNTKDNDATTMIHTRAIIYK